MSRIKTQRRPESSLESVWMDDRRSHVHFGRCARVSNFFRLSLQLRTPSLAVWRSTESDAPTFVQEFTVLILTALLLEYSGSEGAASDSSPLCTGTQSIDPWRSIMSSNLSEVYWCVAIAHAGIFTP